MSGRHADALRDAFDRSFAEPARPRAAGFEQFLAIEAGSAQLAVRISEVQTVDSLPRVTTLPSRVPGLRGIASVRGRIVPVYGLGAVLGRPAEAGVEDTWVILFEAEDQVLALAFTQFQGWIEATPADLVRFEPPDPIYPSLVSHAGALRPVLHLPSLFQRCRLAAGVLE